MSLTKLCHTHECVELFTCIFWSDTADRKYVSGMPQWKSKCVLLY